jgi:L-phenylalanine/L-methionine N-acetyltransferase
VTEPLLIRAATAADIPGITALVNLPKFRFGTARLPFHTPEEVGKWLASRGAGDLNIVAVRGEAILGQAGLRRMAGRRSHTAELGMGVHDDHQREGIGTALLLALLDAADNWLDIRRLELSVYVDNAAALALYGRHGFVIEGTHRALAYRGGAYIDAHTMARLRGL